MTILRHLAEAGRSDRRRRAARPGVMALGVYLTFRCSTSDHRRRQFHHRAAQRNGDPRWLNSVLAISPASHRVPAGGHRLLHTKGKITACSPASHHDRANGQLASWRCQRRSCGRTLLTPQDAGVLALAAAVSPGPCRPGLVGWFLTTNRDCPSARGQRSHDLLVRRLHRLHQDHPACPTVSWVRRPCRPVPGFADISMASASSSWASRR